MILLKKIDDAHEEFRRIHERSIVRPDRRHFYRSMMLLLDEIKAELESANAERTDHGKPRIVA